MMAGTLAGLAMGAMYKPKTGAELLAASDVMGRQETFETILLQQDNGVPRFRQLAIHPYAINGGAVRSYVVTGRYFEGPRDAAGRALSFDAPSPYKAGSALDRVAEATKQDLPAQYAAITAPTVVNYLDLIGDAGFVNYQYAWWEHPRVWWTLWAAGGAVLVGLAWPTLINLLVYRRLVATVESPGPDLSKVNAHVEKPPDGHTEQDLDRLREVEAELEANLRAGASIAAPARDQPRAAVPQLSAAPLQAPAIPASDHDSAEFEMKPRDFYPTHRHAFTLVELLVAIGVIVLLIGILLSVVSSVRKRGQQAKCASNLRQIGLALEMYNQINHELPENTAAAAWTDGLMQLRAATPQLFRCPSNDLSQIDYAMNAQFAGLPKSTGRAGDVLVTESGARHSGRANALYFDGHAELLAAK